MMKLKHLNWVLLAFVALFFTACENVPLTGQFINPDDPSVAEEGQFKALVDGQQFSSDNATASINLDNFFSITAVSDTGETITMGVEEVAVASFNLTEVATTANSAGYFTAASVNNPYTTSGAIGGTGQLTITALDETAQTISGTFSFIGKRPALDQNGDPVIDGSGNPVIETVTIASGVFNTIAYILDQTGGGTGGGTGGTGGTPEDEFFALVDGDEFVEVSISTTMTTVGDVPMINIIALTETNALMRIDIPQDTEEGTFMMEPLSDGTKLIALYNSNTGGENLTSNPGSITITDYDTEEGVLTATFTFTGSDPLNGDPTVVQVTEGSFTVYFEGIPGSGPSPFTAEVDGELYEPENVDVIASGFNGVDIITIDTSSSTTAQTMRLTFPKDLEVGSYEMSTTLITGEEKIGVYNPDTSGSTTFNSNPGTLTIVSFNAMTGELEGTFSFTAEDGTGGDPTVYEITNGEFRITVL